VSLRDEAESTGRNPEAVSLAAVYERVGEQLVLDPGTTTALFEAELAAERMLLRADPGMRERYRRVVAGGTPVVVVADTCLPSPFVAEVFEEQGFPAPHGLLVSGDAGSSTEAVRIWDELLGPAPGRRLVHVGPEVSLGPAPTRAVDTVRVTTVRVTGPVEAYRLQHGPAAALDGPRVFAHLDIDGFRLKNLHRSLLNAQVAVGLSDEPAPSARTAIGYGALGPFLVALVQWLHRTAVERGCSSLVFDPTDGQFLADAYRGWWGSEALPPGPSVGTGPEDARPGEVVSGWDPAGERWDGGPGHLEDSPPPVRLSIGIDPTVVDQAAGEHEEPVRAAAFVDGRLPSLRRLYDDLFGADRGFLAACLGGWGRTPPPAEVVDEVRRAAVAFVADFRALTSGMPSTVAVVDPATAGENLVMVLNFPQPAAVGVLGLEGGAATATG
jgi:hypothetical protein